MEKLKKAFNVASTYQLIIVFIVFGITGSLSLYISGYVLDYLNLKNVILSILMLLIVYQILLIIIGTLFGEFDYFWRMEKKILSTSIASQFPASDYACEKFRGCSRFLVCVSHIIQIHVRGFPFLEMTKEIRKEKSKEARRQHGRLS